MQIVTKLPNENIQNYQLEIFDLGGSVKHQMQILTKLPNENIQKLPTRNVLGENYQMQIVTKLPNENIQNYQLEMFDSDCWGGG